MSELPLPRLRPNDPENHLSEAARRRISDARWEADKIRARTLASLEVRYRAEAKPVRPLSKYLSTGHAAIEYEQSRLQTAQLVLLAMLREYKAAGKRGPELVQIMHEEIGAIANSYELPIAQRQLLLLELDLYKSGSAQPAATQIPGELESPGSCSGTPKPTLVGATEPSRDKPCAVAELVDVAKTTDRRALIDAFILAVSKVGRKIKRKDLWSAAGYRDATEFERFQRGDQRTTQSAAKAFNRLLSQDPESFIELLDKKPRAK